MLDFWTSCDRSCAIAAALSKSDLEIAENLSFAELHRRCDLYFWLKKMEGGGQSDRDLVKEIERARRHKGR